MYAPNIDRNIVLIITRMIIIKKEGRGVTFVTDNRHVCRNAGRPGRPPSNTLCPELCCHCLSDIACRMRLSRIASSQIPRDDAPWPKADQGWTLSSCKKESRSIPSGVFTRLALGLPSSPRSPADGHQGHRGSIIRWTSSVQGCRGEAFLVYSIFTFKHS